ncbi:hypothetical protein CTRI78_v006038 [Colletotrichum trifolii]|uniref:Uncharacterized protein n=1 Tax=Colletotrichum trifolii TaxID=5466 RepID=A0A4R8RDC7_COLTR|nr:hypothetical protein CTRI78_v006038 [Colletotrichum trifolii]
MSEGKIDTPSPCPHLNCLNRTLNFEPNPDIAGNGVVIGFVGTAYLVFVLLLAHYFVAYDPKCPPPKQLCWLLIILLWGTWKLYFAFIDDHYYSGSTSANTRWQFGQVLPVLLLAAPLANMLGVFTSGEAVTGKDQEEEVFVAVVWVHVSVLLPFSLLQLAFATDAGYETTLYSLSGWNVSILDYFFQEGNIYFILFNYPFVGFATILAGSAAESWWKRPVTTKGRVLRNIYFWLLCFALHGGYLTIMYFPNVLWAKFVWTGGATVSIVALYIFASFMNLRRRERRRGTRPSDVD